MPQQLYFIDTNIFVYAFDPGPKKETANRLIREALAMRIGLISYQVVQEFFLTLQDDFLEFDRAGERFAARQSPRRIHGDGPDFVPPATDGVIVFQAKSERVNPGVAGRAFGFGPMFFQPLPEGKPLFADRIIRR